MEAEFVRFPLRKQGRDDYVGEGLGVTVLPECKVAVEEEQRRLKRVRRIRIPREQLLMPPSLSDVVHWLVCGWLVLPEDQRDALLDAGRREAERRMRSADPIPFKLKPPGSPLGGEGGELPRRRRVEGRPGKLLPDQDRGQGKDHPPVNNDHAPRDRG